MVKQYYICPQARVVRNFITKTINFVFDHKDMLCRVRHMQTARQTVY